jgi:hypothetical protein
MLGDRRLTDRQLAHELPHRALLDPQQVEDPAAVALCEDLERRRHVDSLTAI